MKGLFFRYIKDFCLSSKLKVFYFLLILLIILSTVLSVIRPKLNGQVIDMLSNFSKYDIKMYIFVLIIFLSVTIITYIISCLQKYLTIKIAENIAEETRSQINKKLQVISTKYYLHNSFSDIILKSDKDITMIKQCGIVSLISLCSNVLLLLIIIPFMFKIDFWTSIINILLLCFVPILGNYIGKKVQKLSSTVLEQYHYITKMINDTFINWRIVRLFSGYDYTTKRYDKSNENYKRSILVQNKYYILNMASLLLIESLSIATIWIIGSFKVFSGVMTVGTVVTLATYQGIIFSPISNMSSLLNDYHTANASLIDLYSFFNYEERKKGNWELSSKIENIRLENVSFAYNKNSVKIIDNINLYLEKGKLYVFVGKSGSGKSTLFNLISGFLNKNSGNIYINGRNIEDINIESYWNEISYVMQRSLFFLDSIRNNLMISGTEEFDEIKRISKRLDLFDEIEETAQKWDEIVEDNSKNFSEGQIKRLDIIRNLIKKSSLYIFDEPTASLDLNRRFLFFKEMKAIKQNAIIICITHNKEEIQYADKIFEINEGGFLSEIEL